MSAVAFQDQIPHNHCFGCGPGNQSGLRIKSYWEDEAGQGDVSVCSYQPLPHQAAGPRQYLNGGIIATLIDCHAICTAVAAAYRAEGRAIGSPPDLWYVTGSLEVRYLSPTPIGAPVHLRATLQEQGPKKTLVACTLSSGGQACAEAKVVAIRVAPSWSAS